MFWMFTLLLAVILLTVVAAGYMVYYCLTNEVPNLLKWSSVWVILMVIVMAVLVLICNYPPEAMPA